MIKAANADTTSSWKENSGIPEPLVVLVDGLLAELNEEDTVTTVAVDFEGDVVVVEGARVRFAVTTPDPPAIMLVSGEL